MACAAAGIGIAGTALEGLGGTAGITNSGQFRYYANSWWGNQHITTYSVAKFGRGLGALGFGAALATDAAQLESEKITFNKFLLNTSMGALPFVYSPAWPVSISYTITEMHGPRLMGGAMDMLIKMQESAIKDSMRYHSIK